jgi:hypothetical protein
VEGNIGAPRMYFLVKKVSRKAGTRPVNQSAVRNSAIMTRNAKCEMGMAAILANASAVHGHGHGHDGKVGDITVFTY